MREESREAGHGAAPEISRWRWPRFLGLVILVGLVAMAAPARAAASARTAFFYGPAVPRELFLHFDRVVVEPDAAGAAPFAERLRGKPFAYVSVGEVDDHRAYRSRIPKAWVLGRNGAWGSSVVDLASPAYRAFFIDEILGPLWAKGYRGFFFDTLDSYLLVAKTPAARDAQEMGLRLLLAAVVARHPSVELILNRGFDAAPSVREHVVGVAFESLFAGWNATTKKFVPVGEQDRIWLLGKLAPLRALGIPTIAIDYVPQGEPERRREVAQRIAALGIEPWVTGPDLDDLGTGSVAVVPRRVLVVYDGGERVSMTDAHVLAAAILERLGYAVDYVHANDVVPEHHLGGRYAGIVSYLTGAPGTDRNRYARWLQARVREKVPVALLGVLGFEPTTPMLTALGLSASNAERPVRIKEAAPWASYEAPLVGPGRDASGLKASGEGTTPVVRVEDARGEVSDAVVLGPWGGLALDPFVVSGGGSDVRRWLLDPWTFFPRALRLSPLPLPDLTTEAGRRILTVHIDGDGFASRAELPGTPFAGQVIFDRILTKFRVPTTVSVIEGEVGPKGLFPADSPALERIARATFRLPHVEIASHAYSHPFVWSKAEAHELDGGKPAHLAIPGYAFDLRRDIEGSVAYIDERLAPPGKRTRVFLWTGDCSPSREAVALTQSLGLFNVNGGGATQVKDRPSLTQLLPATLPFGDGVVQVYGPVQNDNVYTNHWLGPYYGFRRVLETFALTGAPRRLTPLSIYFHYFSGTKLAGVAALEEVFRAALAEENHPLPLSEYAARAEAFGRVSVARRLDGAFEVEGLGPMRTLAVSPALGYPVAGQSSGLAGYRDAAGVRYLHLTRDAVVLSFAAEEAAAADGPRLAHGNGLAVRWHREGAVVRLRLVGHVPLAFAVAGARGGCTLRGGGRTVVGRIGGGEVAFRLNETDTGDAELACP